MYLYVFKNEKVSGHNGAIAHKNSEAMAAQQQGRVAAQISEGVTKSTP